MSSVTSLEYNANERLEDDKPENSTLVTRHWTVYADANDSIIWLKDEYIEADNSTMVYMSIPDYVNIWKLLKMEMPPDVINMSGWHLGISNKNPNYPIYQNVLQVIIFKMVKK